MISSVNGRGFVGGGRGEGGGEGGGGSVGQGRGRGGGGGDESKPSNPACLLVPPGLVLLDSYVNGKKPNSLLETSSGLSTHDDEDELIIDMALSDDLECVKNAFLKEADWLDIPSISRQSTGVVASDVSLSFASGEDATVDLHLLSPPAAVSESTRETSVSFIKTRNLTALTQLNHILTFKDKAGNTTAHHAAFMGLTKTYNTLVSLGASRYALNEANICPAAVLCGVATLYPLPSSSPPTSSCRVGGHQLPLNTFHRGDAVLFRSLTRRALLSDELVKKAFYTAVDVSCPPALEGLQNALLEMRSVRKYDLSCREYADCKRVF
jgi:hypothetical protein